MDEMPMPATAARLWARASALACLTCALIAAPVIAGPAPRPKVCLVLSGGGARGIAHIGVLKVLEEMRVPIDCIVGTSAGSIIGGAYAAGASPAEIEQSIRGADWDHLLSDQAARVDRSHYTKEVERARIGAAEIGRRGSSLTLPRGLLAGQHLQTYLQSLVAPTLHGSFDELPIPYRALATDFENGHLVILDHGDIAAAIRASMSVPGAFSPVEIDGHLLVDGGLVRNLGVDVARSLGAQRIIAVNVGGPLLRRSELGSLIGAAEQTLNILVEQNVEASLASLGPEDVLISPQLGALSSADFPGGAALIPAGEAATRRAARELESLRVSEEDYELFLARQRRAHLPVPPRQLVVDTSALNRVPAPTLRRLLGDSLEPRDAQTIIDRLLATDDFESVEQTLVPGPDGTTLVLRPVEKVWGPEYLRAGVALNSDLSGRADFTFTVDHRMTWLDSRGLEWRNRLSLGELNSVATELREPLDLGRQTFVAPRAEFGSELRNIYNGKDAIATYRLQKLRIALDAGTRVGHFGELRGGFEAGSAYATRTTGSPLLPDGHDRMAGWHLGWIADGLDNLDFPQSGSFVDAQTHFARKMLGGTESYNTLSVDARQAFGLDDHSLLLAVRYQSSLGSNLPFEAAFRLGGFENMSGYARDTVLADRITLMRAVYRYRLARIAPVLPSVYAGLSLEGADIGRRLNGGTPGHVYGGSLFGAADSAIGPLYLGVGYANGGYVSVFLYVGRP